MASNWDVVKGKWTQLRGEARRQWGKVTDDEWEQIAGDREKLIGKLQERYGWSWEEADRHIRKAFDLPGGEVDSGVEE